MEYIIGILLMCCILLTNLRVNAQINQYEAKTDTLDFLCYVPVKAASFDALDEAGVYSIDAPSLTTPTPFTTGGRPFMAVKSNLLLDAFSAINAELEFPLSNRLTTSAELVFPWWKQSTNDWTWQLLAGTVALKYWLQKRNRSYAGWNVGLSGGYYHYDIQPFNRNGEQGDMWNASVQGGYALPIGRHFRLELTLNVGYMTGTFREYDKVRDTRLGDIKVFRYPWIAKRRNWFGPTNAKVSFVWWLYK